MRSIRWTKYALVATGLLALGGCATTLIDAALYQSYMQWSFDQTLRGQPISRTGFLVHCVVTTLSSSISLPSGRAPKGRRDGSFPKDRFAEASDRPIIGRLEIPSIKLSAAVMEGVDATTLRRAVGHMPGTALPGELGNTVLAGHRDTFFRGLRDIHRNDEMVLTTLSGSHNYIVDSLEITEPTNSRVLGPSREAALTLVTCYPFYFVGPAPKRFVVHAREVVP